jgi:hypothetical protein
MIPRTPDCCGRTKADKPFRPNATVKFLRPTPDGTNDAAGDPTLVDVQYLKVSAEVIPLRQSQQVQGAQQTGLLRYQIRFRYSRLGMDVRHDDKAVILGDAFGSGGVTLEVDGPPANEEGMSRIVRLYGVQRQGGYDA